MVNEPAGTHRRAYGRSLVDFEPLLPAEEELVWATARGVKCELDVVVPDIATDNNRIRAGFLRFLALGGDKTTPLHEKGVCLQGAFIEEAFDLTGANLPANLTLWSCRFDGCIVASGARTRSISFDRSSIATITAYGVQIGGVLSLQDVHANGEVLFLGAHIDGDLECNGGTFENPTGKSLFLDRAKIGGGVFLCNDDNQPFHAKGEVCLRNARIGGDLECNGGTFENPTGKALFLERANIGGGVFLSNADNHGFHATGEVRLVGARIVGPLVCDGGQFENPGVALNFDGAQIGGGVFLRYVDSQPFQAKGEVRLLGAHIAGTLACIGRFENPGGNALSFDRAQIRGSVFLGTRGKHMFRALGEVRLPGAHIDGSLVCGGDLFQNPYRDALVCNNSVVKGAFCLMEDAQIVGNVSLAHAEVGTLEDHPSCWPIGSLALDGFRYARIDASSSSDASARIAWLDKQQERFRKGPEFALSPWTHLAYVLREQGHFLEAEKVEITREDRLRRAGRIVRYGWPVHWLYGKLAGYGYKPGRLVVIGSSSGSAAACSTRLPPLWASSVQRTRLSSKIQTTTIVAPMQTTRQKTAK